MGKLENYNGSIKIIDGLSPFGEDYPLMDAHYVQTGENGKRLDAELSDMKQSIDNPTPPIIQEFAGKYEQTLTVNYYIQPNNGACSSHHDSYYASDFIRIYGDKLYLYGTCSSKDSSSGAGYAFYSEARKYISGGENPYSKNTLSEITIPEDAVYFRYTNYGNDDSFVLYGNSILDAYLFANRVNEHISETIGRYEYEMIENKYVAYETGSVSTINSYDCSDFIKIIGKKLCLYGTAGENEDLAGYAFYDENKVFISGGRNTSSRAILTEIDVPEGAVYFRYSNIKNNSNMSYVYSAGIVEYLFSLKTQASNPISILGAYDFDMVKGSFVWRESGHTASHNSYDCSDFIKIIGKKLCLYGTAGENEDLAGYAFYDENKVFISGGRNTSSRAILTEIDVPEGAVYFRFSSKPSFSDVSYLYSTDVITDVVDICYSAKNSDVWKYALDKICCLGDSLTAGAYYANGWTGASIAQNYPYFLSRMLNADVDNHGKSGWAPSDWWTNSNGVKSITWSNYNAVILWLGTNNGLTDTIDVDVNAFTDYNSYAETETGYYCKIIEYIKEQNNDCLVAIGTVFATDGDVAITNTVISKLSEKYSLPIIDFSNFGKDKGAFHANISNVHFSKTGNIAVANHVVETLEEYFAEDINRCEFGIEPIS